MITDFEAEILAHTSQNGRFVTSDPRVIDMGKRGLLRDTGEHHLLPKGEHYLLPCTTGRDALNEWRAAQPKPKIPKRRRSRQFDAWMTYQDQNRSVSFSEFLKSVWPEWERRYC